MIRSMADEADTCRKFVVPKLQSAGWGAEHGAMTEPRTPFQVRGHLTEILLTDKNYMDRINILV